MKEETDAGQRVRQYFLLMEEKARESIVQLQDPLNMTRIQLMELAQSHITIAIEAEKENEHLKTENLQLEDKIQEDEPKMSYFNRLKVTKGDQRIRDFAKSVNYGPIKMFEWLRRHGYIMRGSTLPYQEYIKQGLFKVTECINNGRSFAVTFITAKGMTRIWPEFSMNAA